MKKDDNNLSSFRQYVNKSINEENKKTSPLKSKLAKSIDISSYNNPYVNKSNVHSKSK